MKYNLGPAEVAGFILQLNSAFRVNFYQPQL